jgi:hypothetical protein
MNNNTDNVKYGSFASSLILKSVNKRRITVCLHVRKKQNTGIVNGLFESVTKHRRMARAEQQFKILLVAGLKADYFWRLYSVVHFNTSHPSISTNN